MEFVDPPVEGRGERSQRWRNIVASLKERPGEWALVGNFSPGVATHIRRGKYRAFLDGLDENVHSPESHMQRNWEVTTRKTDSGNRNDVYIRWIG